MLSHSSVLTDQNMIHTTWDLYKNGMDLVWLCHVDYDDFLDFYALCSCQVINLVRKGTKRKCL